MARSSQRQPGQVKMKLGDRRRRERDPASAKAPDQRLESAGRAGERVAADYLEAKGYRIIARNWRAPETRNEIDLIAKDGSCLVFVEVKTARTVHFGDPAGWITPRKRAAIARAAAAYVVALRPTQREFRFDAVTIGPPGRDSKQALTHVVAAFTLEEGWST